MVTRVFKIESIIISWRVVTYLIFVGLNDAVSSIDENKLIILGCHLASIVHITQTKS